MTTGATVIRPSGAVGIIPGGSSAIFGASACAPCCGGDDTPIVCVCGPIVLDPPSGGPCGVGASSTHPVTLAGTLTFQGSCTAPGGAFYTVPATTIDLAHSSMLVPSEEGQDPCTKNIERTLAIACASSSGGETRDAVFQHVIDAGTGSTSQQSTSAWWRSSSAFVTGLGSAKISASVPLAMLSIPTVASMRLFSPLEPSSATRITGEWDGYGFTPAQLQSQGWSVTRTVTGSVTRTVTGCTLAVRLAASWNVRLSQSGEVSNNSGSFDATLTVRLRPCAGARPGETLRDMVERMQADAMQ